MNLLKQISVFFVVCCVVEGQRTSCPVVNGRSLECKSIRNCPSMQAAIQNPYNTPSETERLRNLLCGWANRIPKVCCNDEVAIPTTTTTTTTTAKPPVDLTNAECVTHDNKPGICTEIYRCTTLLNLVQSGSFDLLTKSHCRGRSDDIVCCELGSKNTAESDCPSQMTAFPPDPSTRCCGNHRENKDKIMGGTNTGIDQYPWLVLIEYTSKTSNIIKTLCGGSLISAKYVLSAGHCVVGPVLYLGTPKHVRLGEYDKTTEGRDCVPAAGGGNDCTDGITRIPIETIIPHPRYNKDNTRLGYDIALIRMTQAAPYTYFIRPICLPTQDVTLQRAFNTTAAGWGAVSSTRRSSSIKQHVELPYVQQDQCQLSYNTPSLGVNLWKGQICAGGEKGKDSCKGDSGGPLMYDNNNIVEIIGVVSFGPTPCGIENKPGVYTNVYEFNSWIRSTIVA